MEVRGATVNQFHRASYGKPPAMDLPTDDWPFLYLIRKTIPSDYLIAIASLLVFSIASIAFLRGRSFGRGDIHFGLLGMGFLLLETKSISDCTLFFGATWFVTLVVIAGILCAAGGVLAFATVRSPVASTLPSKLSPTRTAHPRPPQPTDPAVECAACPVLTPHIRPR